MCIIDQSAHETAGKFRTQLVNYLADIFERTLTIGL